MRYILLISIFAVSAHAEELKAIVEKQGESLLNDRSYAAVMVGVFHEDKEQVFSFGKSEGKAPDRDSVYEIGSVTKTFTGLLLAEAVKRGEVKYDDAVQKYLPAGWIMPKRDDREITFLHLATHTSGLTRQPHGFLVFAIKNPGDPFSKYDVAEMIKGLPQTNVQWAIGAKHEYSNLGVGLLGHALATAAKAKSFESLLKERVLEPLGMNETRITMSDGEKSKIIPGHDAKGKKLQNWTFACMESCGAIRSSTSDMLKYLRANCRPDGTLKPSLGVSQQNWRELSAGKEECGLCWIRFVKKGGPIRIWHNGQTGGYHSFVGFIPGKGGVVVLCNVAIGKVDEVGFRILDKIAEGS